MARQQGRLQRRGAGKGRVQVNNKASHCVIGEEHVLHGNKAALHGNLSFLTKNKNNEEEISFSLTKEEEEEKEETKKEANEILDGTMGVAVV